MVVALYGVAFAMVLAGGGALVRGAPFFNVDWGSTLVLSGTIGASCGALLAGLAAASERLKRLERELVLVREQAAAGWPAAVSPVGPGLALAAQGMRLPASEFPPAGAPMPAPEPRPADVWPVAEARLSEPAVPEEAGSFLVREPALFASVPARGEDSAERAPAGAFGHVVVARDEAPRGAEPAVPDFLARPRPEPPPAHPLPHIEEPDPAEPAPLDVRVEALEPSVPRAVPEPAPTSASEPSDEAESHPCLAEPEIGPGLAIPLVPEVIHSERLDARAGAHASAIVPGSATGQGKGPGSPATAVEPDTGPAEIGRYASGGNSYVMFSDGTIEAETPTGHYRFTSLDELKQFIASGGEKQAPALA